MKNSIDYLSDKFNIVGERIHELEYRAEKITDSIYNRKIQLISNNRD